MDVFAHGLWTGALYTYAQKKQKRPLKVGWAVFWGVIPDLFAFTPVFTWIFWQLVFNGSWYGNMDVRHMEPAMRDTIPIFRLTSDLYSISHSVIIFLAVLGAVLFLRRRIPWEIGGWLLHIFIDVPTHTYRFYPTPVLWPLFGWQFSGIAWSTPWFMFVNYLAIALVYIALKKYQESKKLSIA
ncbi:MAG: hypothetical protein HYT34_00190 [Candidatus Ryanbacteria bacterium]|nr:hypothetical protein [Candidatus Ryanbacteria bacterium]